MELHASLRSAFFLLLLRQRKRVEDLDRILIFTDDGQSGLLSVCCHHKYIGRKDFQSVSAEGRRPHSAHLPIAAQSASFVVSSD